ncbi:AbrB/MazE/SpoVT family DNA-binding domain-containing protein [Aneurinibacillus thermoaerophilus]|nr:AbrB/MazE/SpoVT family DNA-binding domain-containing protein [Aneurinibacillus thermoaerophilus]MED0761857.1 AbrB/MazE/SpoVT family DNA-binding domain-containing protein [Aneurinibacillus thermoaerophilus]
MYIVKVNEHGQIVLPRELRDKLASGTVNIEVQGNKIILKPVN